MNKNDKEWYPLPLFFDVFALVYALLIENSLNLYFESVTIHNGVCNRAL